MTGRALRAFALGLLLAPVAVAAGIAPLVAVLALEGGVRGDPMSVDAAWWMIRKAPQLQGVPALPVMAVLVPALFLAGLPRWALMAAGAVAGGAAAWVWTLLIADASVLADLLSVFVVIQVVPTVALAGAAGALFFDLAWRRWRPECSST